MKTSTRCSSMLRLLAVTITGISLLPNLPLLITAHPPKGDINSDREALLAFYSALSSVGTRLDDWNTSKNVCHWFGINCTSANNEKKTIMRKPRVLEIRLPAVGLIGPIASQSIGKLHALKLLSLRGNNLYGNLPPDIFSITTLTNIHLTNNTFCGDLPVKLFQKSLSLQILDLSLNSFSGDILSLFQKAPRLWFLDLSFNNFSGPVPDIKDFKDLKKFSFKNNMLQGPIPSQYYKKNITDIFDGNKDLCGSPRLKTCPADSPAYPPEQNIAVNFNKLPHHGALVTSSVLFFLLIL